MTTAVANTPQRDDPPRAGDVLDMPVLGMHCAACAARVEKALTSAPGVDGASVNFATSRATVRYDARATDPAALREVVRREGYDAVLEARGAKPGEGAEDA